MVACSEPLLLPLPRGVRMASKTSASLAAMIGLLGHESVHPRFTYVHECMYPPRSAWPPVTPTRHTQEERRATTRAALLGTAIECLVEYGYEGTTTGRVCDRAGVSRGAHLHHFRTRPALVAAALAELAAATRRTRFRGEVEDLPDGDERVEAGARPALELVHRPAVPRLGRPRRRRAHRSRATRQPRPRRTRISGATLACCRQMFAADVDDPARSADPDGPRHRARTRLAAGVAARQPQRR